MEKVKMTLAGFKRGEAKETGNPYVQLFIAVPPVKSKYGETNIRIEWAPKNQISDDWAACIGKEVDLDYGFNEFGKPRLEAVKVK